MAAITPALLPVLSAYRDENKIAMRTKSVKAPNCPKKAAAPARAMLEAALLEEASAALLRFDFF